PPPPAPANAPAPSHPARDSKLGSDSPILTVTAAEWRALLTAIQAHG
ncbi:MAG: DUF397 domain-containing protein, partial [Actinobacteria bacterium]|nr:DUF397 domain-containing protein [Actinomycetota bacterium]